MVLVKIKTLKELKDLNIFDFEYHGDMIEIKRKNEPSAGICLDSSYFGQIVLVTNHTAIHANAITFIPELVDASLGEGYISKKSYNILKEKFFLIKKIVESNLSFKMKELESKLSSQPDQSKLIAKVSMLEAQLDYSKKVSNKWRAEYGKLNKDFNVADARKVDNQSLHYVGQEAYKKVLCSKI